MATSVEIEDIGAIGAEISHTTGGIAEDDDEGSGIGGGGSLSGLQRHNAIIYSPLDLQHRNFAL